METIFTALFIVVYALCVIELIIAIILRLKTHREKSVSMDMLSAARIDDLLKEISKDIRLNNKFQYQKKYVDAYNRILLDTFEQILSVKEKERNNIDYSLDGTYKNKIRAIPHRKTFTRSRNVFPVGRFAEL